MQVTENSQ